ncbi:MAG: phosphatidate cytidylyltransferase [Candidatus Omnitrophica bacterium]|nr:phosphatidate cytidylyltransferase [Candidatus Omnitrophota bacterium]
MITETDPLAKRLVTSAILIAVSVYTIFFATPWFFFLVVEALMLLGLNEFLTLAEKKGIVINHGLGLFFGALLPLSYFFPSESLIFVIGCLAIFVFNFHRKLREQALVSTAVTVFGLVYVAWFFSFLMKIRYLPNGAKWVFYTILIVKLGDAAAYFFGKAFGRMKLVEHISPKKSVEGAIAGFLTTVLTSLVSKVYLPHVDTIHLFVMGVAIGLLAGLGDLAESLIKRDVGVKDSGTLPGLGGMLDVLDSLLLSIPFVYYYITAFPGVY